MVFLCLFAMMTTSFAQATQTAYAHQDVEQLRALMEQADSQTDSLLVRYRLYPLTEDADVLQNIPSDLSDGSAREYALLSGLWAYRAGESSIFSAVQYGRRSTNLLEQAKKRGADDPFVLLVEGQSLLFRPAIAGRDPTAAAQRFSRLAGIVAETPGTGISPTEAQVWQWLALREANHSEEAASVHADLRAQSLPPLYRQFLEEPPKV
jgi:hypothetical protein